jgi:IS5 family transposase
MGLQKNRVVKKLRHVAAEMEHGQRRVTKPISVTMLRDRGYFGAKAKGIDFTVKRRTTEKPLGELDKERNRLISKLRSPGERPHAVIKRVFKSGWVLVVVYPFRIDIFGHTGATTFMSNSSTDQI